jgi:prefoldin subunit 5
MARAIIKVAEVDFPELVKTLERTNDILENYLVKLSENLDSIDVELNNIKQELQSIYGAMPG